MDEVERIIHEYSGDEVNFGGYLNVDLRRNHAHTRYITERCRAHGLKFGWMNPNATPESTFVSHDLRRRSIIDHFVFSEKLFDTIVGIVDLKFQEPRNVLSYEVFLLICNLMGS